MFYVNPSPNKLPYSREGRLIQKNRDLIRKLADKYFFILLNTFKTIKSSKISFLLLNKKVRICVCASAFDDKWRYPALSVLDKS